MSTESLGDLLFDRNNVSNIFFYRGELFLKQGNATARRVKLPAGMTITPSSGPPILSPDGKHIAIVELLEHRPDSWQDYTASTLRSSQFFYAYVLVDLSTQRSTVLWNFPKDVTSNALWSQDSRHLILSGVFLPLSSINGTEKQERESKSFTIQLTPVTGEFEKISDEMLQAVRWNEKTGDLILQRTNGPWHSISSATVAMRKSQSKWVKVADQTDETQALPEITLEQDLNTPPKIYVIAHGSHKKSLLLDLNPQFAALRLGKVEEIKWTSKDGHRVGGELYYPVGYAPGTRYPLVIQTHGSLGPTQFSVEGAFSSGYAAQPLAGKGVMVLQLGEWDPDDPWGYMAKYWDSPEEAVLATGVYESAIDLLDSKGLIDRNLVGLQGFSRTCLYVKFTLTHSKYHFAAAAVEDGIDAGYFQYIAHNSPIFMHQSEKFNGGLPFGDGLKSWVEKSPSFNADKVLTPIRIIASSAESALGEWEWFALLSRLDKPVELVMLHDATHLLVKPWDRMVSQQGNVDWFSFWLKSDEDPNPVKREQYSRWRAMRERNSSHPSI